MKKTKYLLTIFVALAMFLTLMAGCNSGTNPSGSTAGGGGPDNSASSSSSSSSSTPETNTPPFTELVMYTDGTPGSAGDMAIRTLGAAMEKQAGITVTYKNISGGSGTNVMTEMMNDENHICVVSHTCSLPLSWITGSAAYGRDEIAVVAPMSVDYNIVFTRPESPFNSWADVVAYAKEHPGELTWGGTGVKGSQQLLYQLFVDELGIDIVYIPYDGASAVQVGVLAGDVDMGSCAFGNILNDVSENVYKGLVVTSPYRFDTTPDLETVSEAGISTADSNAVWRAFFCPTGYDEATMEYISDLFANAKDTPEWDDYLSANNQIRWDLSLDEMEAFIDDYLELSSTAISHIQ